MTKIKEKQSENDDAKLNLTRKQAKWLSCYIDSNNLDTYVNATASAKAAKYNCTSYHSFAMVGQDNLKKLAPLITEALGESGITKQTIMALLSDALRATKSIFVDDGSGNMVERIVADYQARVPALRLAGKFLGMESPQKHEHSGVGGKDLEITVKPGMTPKEAVQACEAMLREP